MSIIKIDWQHEQTMFGQIEKVTMQYGESFGAKVSGPHTFKSMDEASAFIAGAKAAEELFK